jgi:nickel-dependent lactate racemase
LAYGRDGLDVEVPDTAVVVEPTELDGLDDEGQAVLEALRSPISGPTLAELLERRAGGQVAVVFPDLTRPMPNRTVLPPLLAELERLGAGPDRVELLCATGTHRQGTAAEMAELVGEEILARYRVHQHRADDGHHVMVGRVDGTPILLDARYVSADIRIVTGFVEPHFFAGFSGGPKGVCPGLADTGTILEAHSPTRIADPAATWLVTEGNPVHDFVRAAVALDPPDLSVDVTINSTRRLTSVFCGPLPDGHLGARAFVEKTAVKEVDRRFEVVLTTNGGHPLDRNLYQAVKGMAAAERVVADAGIIVVAAACGDGLPDGGAFARLLAEAHGPADLARAGGDSQLDRWQVQVMGRVLSRSQVWLHTGGLDDEAIRSAHLHPARDLDGALAAALSATGPGARCCVLPLGPFTVVRAP